MARIVRKSLRDCYEEYKKTPQSIKEININLRQQLISTQKLLLRLDVAIDSIAKEIDSSVNENRLTKQELFDQLDEMYDAVSKCKRQLKTMSAYVKALESVKEDLYEEVYKYIDDKQ